MAIYNSYLQNFALQVLKKDAIQKLLAINFLLILVEVVQLCHLHQNQQKIYRWKTLIQV
jgi:hypothetical protein